MNKVLYSIIALLLVGIIWLYFQQSDALQLLKNSAYDYSKLETEKNEQNEKIVLMENKVFELEDSIHSLISQNAILQRKPTTITKKINRNEKVIPVSEYSSQYYNRILTKRYQNK